MAGNSSVSGASGASVTIRGAGTKEVYFYPVLIGGQLAHPFYPGPGDDLDIKRGNSKSDTFDVSAEHREAYHVAFDLRRTHPAGAQAWGRMHKSGDFKGATRLASDLMRSFLAPVASVYDYHKRGQTIRGGEDKNFLQAPVITCVTAIHSTENPDAVIGIGLHAFFHREREDMIDADIAKEKARFRFDADAPKHLQPSASRLKKWDDLVNERDAKRVPVKALESFLARNAAPLIKGGGFHSAGRSAGAASDRAAASAQGAMLEHPDLVTRERYNEAARALMANIGEENKIDFEAASLLPLDDDRCIFAPRRVFSLDQFKMTVEAMGGLPGFGQDEIQIGADHPEFEAFCRVLAEEGEEVPAYFMRRHWFSSDGYATPIFPYKGKYTWRVSPDHFQPGKFDLCYFPWVSRLRCSEETAEFKAIVGKYYISACVTYQIDANALPPNQLCMDEAKRKAHELLDPKTVTVAGVDDLEAARAECHRIMADAEMQAARKIAAADGKLSEAEVFKIQAAHRRAAQLNGCTVLARCLHQDADLPDAVVALVRWADNWRVKRKNFSLAPKKISKNLTWLGEMLAYWSASHEVFFNEFTQHKGATLADLAIFSVYFMRSMNFNPVYHGPPGCGKSFIETCAIKRWIEGTWVDVADRSDASHRIASNKGCHLMMEITDELDPSDVGVVGAAGMTKAMQDTAQTKRACTVRGQETTQMRSYEVKDRKDGVGPWELHAVKMRSQTGKIACTNMSPSMIPSNSADRKCFINVVKRDKKDETLRDKTIKKMPEHLTAAMEAFIDWIQRNQFMCFCIGQLFDCGLIKDTSSSVSGPLLVRLLGDAGDAGVQKTDSIRDKNRLDLIADVLCALDKGTQLLDSPLNGAADAEMDIEGLLRHLLNIEPMLVTSEEHVAASWSMLDTQFEDPMLKPVLDGIINWQKHTKTPLLDLKQQPYKIFRDDETLDISGTREQRNERKRRIEEAIHKQQTRRKLKESSRSAEEQLKIAEDIAIAEAHPDLFEDGFAARDMHMRPPPLAAGGGDEKKSKKLKHAKNSDALEPGQQVLSAKGIDKLASDEFVEFEWEEKDAFGRARRIADAVYKWIPGRTKPSLETIVDACFSLLRMVVQLPGGLSALAVNVTRDPNNASICKMSIARVLLETNVKHKTRCFLEHVLLGPLVPRQTFVFCYPYHDRPHIWHTWCNDPHKDWMRQDDRPIWFQRHAQDIMQRRRDEDIVFATKCIGVYRETYANAIQSARAAHRGDQKNFIDPVEMACREGKKAPPVDPKRPDLNDQLYKLALIASNAPSDNALWRNNSFVDSSTRRVASKYASGAKQLQQDGKVASKVASIVKESAYLLVTDPPGELALAERLYSIRWDVNRIRDLILATPEETRFLQEKQAWVRNLGAAAIEEFNERKGGPDLDNVDDLAILGKLESRFDDLRLQLARRWLDPSLCQHLLNELYNRSALQIYPLEFDILSDTFDYDQRKLTKSMGERLSRSTSVRMHAFYRAVDPEMAAGMHLSATFKECESVYHRSVEAQRVAGKKETGTARPMPNRVANPPTHLLLEKPRRNIFELLRNWKNGTLQISEVQAQAGIEPPKPAAAENGSGKEAKRSASVSPARARGGKGSKRKTPATPSGDGKARKRARIEAPPAVDAAVGRRGGIFGQSRPSSSSSSAFSGLSPSDFNGGGGDDDDDGSDKENEEPPARPVPRAAAAAAAAAAPPEKKAVAKPFVTPALQDMLQKRKQKALDEAAAKAALEAERAADRAALQGIRELERQADLEAGEAEADIQPMDQGSDGELEEEEATLALHELGDEEALALKGVAHLGQDADHGLSKRQLKRMRSFVETEAGDAKDNDADIAMEREADAAAKAANADGDEEMPPAADEDEGVKGRKKLSAKKAKKDTRKKTMTTEEYAAYKQERREKKQKKARDEDEARKKQAEEDRGAGGSGPGGVVAD